MPTTTAEQLADRLEARPTVAHADALAAAHSPRDRAEVEIVLTADVRGLPEPLATALYDAGWRPFRLGSRCPGHHYVLAEPAA